MSPFNVIQSEDIFDSLTRCWCALRNDERRHPANYKVRYIKCLSNDVGLQKSRTKYKLRNCFTNRVSVNLWNCLPNSVVHAACTDTFSERLDNFWSSQ